MSSKPTSSIISFADVAHQMLNFDTSDEAARLVLELIDTRWMQRLRNIRQTGNTFFVYMFAEHSRFGHSLGVAYLALQLMNSLSRAHANRVNPYRNAVAAAAILHDIGHVAPGSHTAERVWGGNKPAKHEQLTMRIISEDPEIVEILNRYGANLIEDVQAILSENPKMPSWTSAIISGGGWNADRGNWAIVDSAMCSVSYGRYNVQALTDSFVLSDADELVIRENRLDSLTHFFVARDSMYRQVYQHRTTQVVDRMMELLVKRLRELIGNLKSPADVREKFSNLGIFADDAMIAVLLSNNYASELPMSILFDMTESWWYYHLNKWTLAGDNILVNLALRLRDRRLFKTIRLQNGISESDLLVQQKAADTAKRLGFDARYYVAIANEKDRHRKKKEEAPKVLLDSGDIVPVTQVEPLVKNLFEKAGTERVWLIVPAEVKKDLLAS